MKVYTDREIRIILKENDFSIIRTSGGHDIYEHRVTKRKLSLNHKNVNRMVFQRLVKEFNIKCSF